MPGHRRVGLQAGAGTDHVGDGRVATFFVRLRQARNRTYRRDNRGRFSASSGSGAIRPELDQPDMTAGDIGRAAQAEALRITGRDIPFDYDDGENPEVVRFHSEAVLQGLERFPDAPLVHVGSYDPASASGEMGQAFAYTDPVVRGGVAGFEIQFNQRFTRDPDGYQETLGLLDRGQMADPTIMGTAHHEFGHVVTQTHTGAGGAPRISVPADAVVSRLAAADGRSKGDYVRDEVSHYGATNVHELAAEAYGDVVAHGDDASSASKAIFTEIENAASPRNAASSIRVERARTKILVRKYTRDKDGKFSSTGGIRQSLQDAGTTAEVAAVLKSEVSAILGRDVRVGLAGLDVDVARAHAEGILQGAEAYPDARLRSVGTYGADSPFGHNAGMPAGAYAVTMDGDDIYFNTAYGHIDDLTGEMAHSDSIGHLAGTKGDLTRIAAHEMGHVVAATNPLAPYRARAIAERHAGSTRKAAYVREHLSGYANTNAGELFAEAFMDVVSSGGSAFSREIVDAARGGAPALSRATFFVRLEQSRQRLAARQYTRDSDGQFASTGRGDGEDDDFADDFEDDDVPEEVNREFDNDKLSADFKARYGEVVMEGDAGDGHRVVLTDKNGIHIVDDRAGLGQRKVVADLNGPTAAYLHEVTRDAWESDTATSEPVGEGAGAVTVHGDGEGAITIDWPGGAQSRLPNDQAEVEDFVTGVEAVVNTWWRSRPKNRLVPTFFVRLDQSRALNRQYKRDRDGKFSSGGGGGATGQDALDAVPAALVPGERGHFGDYAGESLSGPPGAGPVRALSEYEGVEYQTTNSYLRHGPALRDDTPADIREDVAQKDADTAARIAGIDQTMAASQLATDVQVDRGVARGKDLFGDAWHEGVINKATTNFDEQDREHDRWQAGERPDLTGLRFRDKGYTSTSADPYVAEQFVARRAKWQRESPDSEGEPVVMRIHVPAGTGGVQMGTMAATGTKHGRQDSAEILLERGLTFEVTADHGVDDQGIRRLDVSVVPQ